MSMAEARLRSVAENYGKLPITFVENAGQARPDVRYYANRSGFGVGFAPDEAMFVFTGHVGDKQRQGLALSLRFPGANPKARLEGCRQDEAKFNYLIGNDPAEWRTNLPAYREVAYRELWPGIDLIFHGDGAGWKLKYDVVVQPGAKLDDIRFAYVGADRLSIDEKGNLLIHTAYGVLTEERPVSYQEIDGSKINVESRFVPGPGEQGSCSSYGFEICDEGYDPGYPLIIDPALFYSTFLGGSGMDAGHAIAVDNTGSAYVTGQTSSVNFPATTGAFQIATGGGASDVFVAKLNASGTALVYSTYLGGSGLDSGNGIAVDSAGGAYVTGSTASADFPVTAGAFQTTIAGASAAFVTKLNAAGTALAYSTYLGGSDVDSGNAIAVDGSGSAYVTGSTDSADFPTRPGVFPTISGGTDAFITKVNAAGTGYVYSSFIGGFRDDIGTGIAIDSTLNAYVTGTTFSADYPTTAGVVQTSLRGASNGFITRFDANGTALVYSTYLGGSGSDTFTGIAVDGSRNAYLTGETSSANFPTTTGAYQTTLGGTSDAFVTKLNATGAALAYSTYLGGGLADGGNSIAVDGSGNAYVTGQTGSTNFPTTADAFQDDLSGTADAFVTQLNAAGTALVFSTYIGGSGADIGRGIAVDNSNSAYVTGQTDSIDFPATIGVFQPSLGGDIDAFMLKFGEGPQLAADKFANRFEVVPGETVTFFIEVVNSGTVTLTNVAIEDSLLGISQVIAQLAPSETRIITADFLVPADTAPGLVTNTATITAEPFAGAVTVQSFILVTANPALLLTKTASPTAAAPGETIVFTITIANQGNVDLLNVVITDPLLDLTETIGDIPAGAAITIEWPFDIPPDAEAGLTIANTVLLSADNLPHVEEVGTAVEVLAVPRLEIEKTASLTVVAPGQTVSFAITVANTGNTTLTNVAVTDDLTHFNAVIPSLAVGQTEALTIPFSVPLETPPQTYTNTAAASSDQTALVSDTQDVTVSAVPRLGIAKSAELETVAPGQTFTYTIILTNIGNVTLTGIQLTDPMLGIDQPIPALAVGQSFELAIPFTVPQSTPIGSGIVNLLTVTSAEAGTQQAEAAVTVAGAGLSLDKTADQVIAAPGETINYTLTVINLLAIPQTNVVLSDPLLGIGETVASLPAGGTITRFGSFAIPAVAANGSVIVNTFAVSSDQIVTQQVTADVVVRTGPDVGAETTLAVLKLPDRNEAAPGETVRYTVQVTNTGANPAANVVVSDSLTGTMAAIPVIAPGETEFVTFAFTIPAAAAEGTVFANRATVTWLEQPEGSPPIVSEARVIVAFPSALPEINVDVEPGEAEPGETVAKTITVANVSSQTLANVRVIDPLIGFDTLIPLLAPGERRVFTRPFLIPPGTAGGTVFENTVTVFSDQTPPVQAEVPIQTESLPNAVLTQTVDRTEAQPGERVIFTIQVRNTGNVDLLSGVLTVPLLGIQLRIASFEAGASETIRVPFVIPEAEEDATITSIAAFVSANGPSRQASASVRVIVEEE